MYPIIQKTLTFKLSVAVVCLSILSACGNNSAPNDGVPNVDPKNIVVDGNTMTPTEFAQKYCIGKDQNETCAKVRYEAEIQFYKR